MTITIPEVAFKNGLKGNINPDFLWSEFITTENKNPSLEVLKNVKSIAGTLSFYKHTLFKGAPVIVTGGWRSWEHHVAIYAEINAQRKREGKVPFPVPKHSAHLSGLAVDFTVKGFTILQLFNLMNTYHFGGVEKTDGNWQHIDNRGENQRFKGDSTPVTSTYDIKKHNELFHPTVK